MRLDIVLKETGMNERIKELAEQSTRSKYWNATTQVMIEDFDKEKFAELIVRECAEVAYKRSVHSGPSDIFKHFGVEE
jgi:L-rhamnose mutarotase